MKQYFFKSKANYRHSTLTRGMSNEIQNNKIQREQFFS